MKQKDFMEKLILAYEQPNVYKKGGWGKWNGKSFEFDCVCYIKSILWGWNNERSGHGGAKYASNGVPDIGTEKMIRVCTNVSTDFSNVKEGELVWMEGHVGIADGKGNVCSARKPAGRDGDPVHASIRRGTGSEPVHGRIRGIV